MCFSLSDTVAAVQEHEAILGSEAVNAPLKSPETWAVELAREVSVLPGKDFLPFLAELSNQLTARSQRGPESEREIMAALAEHFGDADDAVRHSSLSE